MTDGRDGFVTFAGQDWWYHGQAHCDFQVSRRLAERGPVLVVNSIGMRMPTAKNSDAVWSRIWRKAKSTLRYLRRPYPSEQMWVMTPFSIPVFSNERLRRANARLVAVQVWFVARLVVRVRRPDVILVVPTALDVVDALKWPLSVYYRADDHAATDGVDHTLIAELEERLLREATLTCYSSRALMEGEASRVRRRVMLLDHGVDVDHFVAGALDHAAVADIAHPRIGFFGQIENESIDIELLDRLATTTLPGGVTPQLVLIGRVAMDLGPLARRANVHVLGWQPYGELPALASGFDVAICPMPNTEWVRAANPIKIKEYLALGLPVVARSIPHLDQYEHVLTLASSNDDFVRGVRRALAGDAPGVAASRRSSVIHDTWSARAAQLVDALDSATSG